MPEWRRFEAKQLHQAWAWAAAGGIAVHMSGTWTPPGRKNPCPCAHLLGPDRETLTAAAASLGQKPRYIQRASDPDPKYMHFDLWGAPLEKALRRCTTDQED
jgi:hypothetical protein